MTSHIIIAGGGYAGFFAAARLRKYSGMKVTLIDSRPNFVERVRMHEYLAGREASSLSYRELLHSAGMEFIQGHITALQPDQQTLTVSSSNGSRQLAYDWLLYGLGSRTRQLANIPGLQEHASTLDAGPRLDATRERLRKLPTDAAVVILGAGLTGLEAATEIKETYPHLQVTLLCASQAFPGYSKGADREIRRVLQRLGVHLREHSRITEVHADHVRLADGSSVPSDLAVHCLGFEVPTLARESGIRTHANGQVQVDEYLRSLSHPSILAIGDSAELPPTYVAAQRMSCASACPMGSFAADTLNRLQKGQNLLPFRFGFMGRCISLGRRAAVIQMVKPDDTPRALFFRGRVAVWVKEWICIAVVKVPLWELRSGLALNSWFQPKGKLT